MSTDDYLTLLARVYLAAPDFSEEEQLLETVLNRACDRTNRDVIEIIDATRRFEENVRRALKAGGR